MPSGIAVRLPLMKDDIFGAYGLIEDYTELVKQNFKMLLLTIPGEKMMNPDYGVGLKKYLFELDNGSVHAEINDRILAQTKRYMKYIQLNKIDFSTPELNPDFFPHSLSVSINFTIIPLQVSTMIQIDFKN